jgi:hypothetical protein
VLLILFGGLGVALALLGRSDHKAVASARDAAVELDAGVDAATVDAAVDAAVAIDAAVDAGVVIAEPFERDAGRRPVRIDAGVVDHGVRRIQVITKPEGATLYVGDSYRGPSGVNLEEPFGTKLKVKCTLPGYSPGYVDLIFDGETEVSLCIMKRIKRCVDEIKNPFDDCP